MINSSSRWQAVILVVGAVLIFFIGVQYGKYSMVTGEPQVVPSQEQKSEVFEENGKADKNEKIKVHVAGAVFNSGLYEFESGSRVDDAVKKAIPLPDADLDRLNLAMPLKDGEQIYVYYKGERNQQTSSLNSSDNEKEGKININSCSAEKLEELPGIGPALASRIIQYRTQNGLFSSVEELKKVSGIGDKKLESIRELVTVY
ncbi:MAG: competence protein ComEA [Clostridia bacterium]|jgi:competence protein ComEA|nr:ComEA protein [Clostridiales bacterium]MDK2984493.1 competence protein ComEA [Clostridia bacterium]